MHIVLITPAPAGSTAGNRATAERWAGLLEQIGHSVSVVTGHWGEEHWGQERQAEGFESESCDLFIALHAWRSHGAVERFREVFPDTPVIVALTGTDIYDHQHRFPNETLRSMDLADCLIGLHHQVSSDIPDRFTDKLVTVLQSADRPDRQIAKDSRHFQICVIGHLRDEKDSLRAALASRLLSDNSRIRIVNAGRPATPEWRTMAEDEQEGNPRFEWLGEIGKSEVQALMQGSRLMVISSVMEGGANVVSEACRMGLPILASDIPGNVGLLGKTYPGYFKTGDEQELARLLEKAETSAEFVAELTARVSQLAAEFTPEAEQAALASAIEMALARRAGPTRSG